MIDRHALRFRFTLLYACCAFVLLSTIGLAIVGAIFANITRPLARDLAASALRVEDEVAAAPAWETSESVLRRIIADNERDGVMLVGVGGFSANTPAQTRTQLPPGEVNIGGLFGLSPIFIDARGGAIVVIPDRAKLSATLRNFYLTVAIVFGFALLIAWRVARIGTRVTLEPLLTVTAELERFASGDFTPRPQSVSGQTEFGALAAAYNGASQKVSEAFLERQRVEQQIRQFVAEAGHELRTPLTVVAGYLDVLRRGGFDDVDIRNTAFASLAIETKRMRTLVERLMTLARLDRVLEAEPEVVDVGTTVRQAVRALAVVAESPISLDAPEDCLILGEPVDLYEAVANLLENAVKYGAKTPVAVSVTAASDGIAVRVRDGGPGIRDADRSHIFERFYRGADRGATTGSGLGLAIAVKAAERLRGRIVLEDARAGSTTFALLVPALEGVR
jgi:signal transduction histidine kinase